MGRSLLLLVSGFLIIFGIIQNSVQNRQQALQERAPEYYYQEQSRNIAGAMLEVALGNINSGNSYLPENAEGSIMGTTINMMDGTGRITGASPNMFNTRFDVTISGEIERMDGSKIITEIEAVFNRNPFSIYAYFTDIEPEIYFVTGDVLNGPVHTNGQFNIDGDPVFNGPVSSPNNVSERSGSDPQYNGGSDFGANEVELPTEAPEVTQLARTENGGIGQYNEPIYVEFKGNTNQNNNGTVEITELNCTSFDGDGNCNEWTKITDTAIIRNLIDFNGVISSTGKVYVDGEVDGQATVHSESDVEIYGDLVYENRKFEENGEAGPISDDRLGIVSEGNTIIDDNAHEADSFGSENSEDVYVDASILSLGDSFKVEGYNDGDSRGTLNILGGLIQRKRGAVGLISGSGYIKNYSYDTRFLNSSTPGFPRKVKFEIENWKESTRIEQPNN
jgi:cytoskeletal protein CcmA (bactofilin family)